MKADEAGEEDACLVRVLVRPLGGGLVGGDKREGRAYDLSAPRTWSTFVSPLRNMNVGL